MRISKVVDRLIGRTRAFGARYEGSSPSLPTNRGSMKLPYWKLFVTPPALFILGFLMNSLVMAMNNNQMPVFIPGGCPVGTDLGDGIHTCMNAHTHLKALADWILIPGAIASPGDMFLWTSEVILKPFW